MASLVTVGINAAEASTSTEGRFWLRLPQFLAQLEPEGIGPDIGSGRMRFEVGLYLFGKYLGVLNRDGPGQPSCCTRAW